MGRKSRAKALHRVQRARISAREPTGSAPLSYPGDSLTTLGDSLDSAVAQNHAQTALRRVEIPPRDGVGDGPTTILANSSLSRPDTHSADAVEHLRSLAAERQEINRALENEVVALLNGGQSWTSIGRALGLTRQGARQRYQRVLDRPD
jgi:hypothetical protein